MKNIILFIILFFLISCSMPVENWYDIDISEIDCNKSDLNEISKWVNKNIDYVVDGRTEYPRVTLKKKYGECRDQSVLMNAIFYQETRKKADIAIGYYNGHRGKTHAVPYYNNHYYCNGSFEKLYIIEFDEIKYYFSL